MKTKKKQTKKPLKNIKREIFVSLIQLLCLLLLITWVSLFRTGNFSLILVPEIVCFGAVGLFVRMNFMNQLTDHALLSELAARNLRVRSAAHLYQLNCISRHAFCLLIPLLFFIILFFFLLFSYFPTTYCPFTLTFLSLKKLKFYRIYFEHWLKTFFRILSINKQTTSNFLKRKKRRISLSLMS